MRKYILNDRKSNLNTSCASDSYSSLLSSAYEVNVNESIAKIQQLKKLYLQTCEEEIFLENQNAQLNNLLSLAKAEVESLIENKYGCANIDKKKKVNPKKYKPGTITKINRSKQFKVPTKQTHQNQDYSIGDPQKRMHDQKLWCRSPRNYAHNRRQSLLPQKSTKEFEFEKNAEIFVSQKLCGSKKHKYNQSVQFNWNKKGDGQFIKKQSSRKLVSQMMQFPGRSFKKQQGRVKSYLNSPRASIVNSPRNIYFS